MEKSIGIDIRTKGGDDFSEIADNSVFNLSEIIHRDVISAFNEGETTVRESVSHVFDERQRPFVITDGSLDSFQDITADSQLAAETVSN